MICCGGAYNDSLIMYIHEGQRLVTHVPTSCRSPNYFVKFTPFDSFLHEFDLP